MGLYPPVFPNIAMVDGPFSSIIEKSWWTVRCFSIGVRVGLPEGIYERNGWSWGFSSESWRVHSASRSETSFLLLQLECKKRAFFNGYHEFELWNGEIHESEWQWLISPTISHSFLFSRNGLWCTASPMAGSLWFTNVHYIIKNTQLFEYRIV